jgi:hydrogenase expression/formation protein
MTDLEGISKRLLSAGVEKAKIVDTLVAEYRIWKHLSNTQLYHMATTIVDEAITSQKTIEIQNSDIPSVLKTILDQPVAGVTMGDGGVGCRGKGDFFVHHLIAKLSDTSIKPLISPQSLDDTGAITWNSERTDIEGRSDIILTKMEGMHSRLSDVPFLAGFHVTRAALRDIYVKGGKPLAIMVDVHLADDGDIGKLFDFQAGIAAVAEVAKVPITAGSTLRIGGDMVIGNRLTGGIAAIGAMKHSFFRKNIQAGDWILMTEGAGGGTITTAALYFGDPEVVQETLNLKFLQACESLFQHPDVCAQIHAMADVTNGGLRGDLYEINANCLLGAKINIDNVRELVNPRVLAMLGAKGVDFLGVSLDALLVYGPRVALEQVKKILSDLNIRSGLIGEVITDQKVLFTDKRGEEIAMPRFRESAYTKIKVAVDTEPEDENNQQTLILAAFQKAQKKRDMVVNFLRKLGVTSEKSN